MINGQMENLLTRSKENGAKSQWIEELKRCRRLEHLDRSILACVLDKVTVYETEDEKIIDIKLKYTL